MRLALCLTGRAEKTLQLLEVAHGLEYLHSQLVVHGDLRGVRAFHSTASLADALAG